MRQDVGVDFVGPDHGGSVGGSGDFCVFGSGDGLRNGPAAAGGGDSVVFGCDYQGGDSGEVFEPGGGVVGGESSELFEGVGRVVGEVVAEVLCQVFGEGGVVLRNFTGREEHLQKRATPRMARANPCSDAGEESERCEAGGVGAFGDGTHEGEASDTFGGLQGELLGDDSTHGMADDVGGIPVLRVHEGEGVFDELQDGDG